MILKNKHFYLSGPIEFNQGDWRERPKSLLEKEFEINVFDPYVDPKQQWKDEIDKAKNGGDYEKIAKIAKSFFMKDMNMVQKCDALIAYLPASFYHCQCFLPQQCALLYFLFCSFECKHIEIIL